MRLKEDSDNYRASNVKRKLAMPPEEPVAHGKKDTKKWCKGVVGRVHDYKYTVPPNEIALIAGFRKVLICTNCGRKNYHNVLYRQKDGTYGRNWLLR